MTQILDKINDKQAYDIIYNFVEKYPGKYPHELVLELFRFLDVKYNVNTDVITFKEILNLIYNKIEKENNFMKLVKLERELQREPTKALRLNYQREKCVSPHTLQLYVALKK